MLTHLHVKNLALIRETEIEFTEGLNILTGETGAGKSLVIGSVNLALGGKFSREMLRPGADYALAELVFTAEEEKLAERLKQLDVFPEEGQVIISRKLMDGRSVNKINGETVTLARLKEVSSLLIDVHGQHEHQSLLQKKKHLEILDAFGAGELKSVKKELGETYRRWKDLKKELSEARTDEDARLREISLLEFEVDEIEKAGVEPGEDERLEQRYQKMINARRIAEAVATAYALTGYEEAEGAGSSLGRALRELQGASSCDGELSALVEQLTELDGLLNDFNRDLSEYRSGLEFEEAEFAETEERLNQLNYLKARYGKTLDEVLAYEKKQQERLELLKNYDEYVAGLEKRLTETEKELAKLCGTVTTIRKKAAGDLCGKIRSHLVDLNFLNAEFEMHFEELSEYTAQGKDDVEFRISTNPGEPLRPLMKVASGGELSRIMLAIKTVLADRDEIETVIFDEIDVGISGRTAQKVSEKMMLMGKTRQVICITHLAQIAAMADSHYRIEKHVEQCETHTAVRRLSREESVQELARILGGAEITDAVVKNAEEMKKLAENCKSQEQTGKQG